MFKDAPLLLKVLIVLGSMLLSLYLAVTFFTWSLFGGFAWLALCSFCICWVLIGMCFMIFQTFKYLRFPASYYQRRTFESERWFRSLQVPFIRRVITKTFIRHLNPRIYLKDRRRDQIRIIHEETRQSETSHLISGVLTLIVQIIYLSAHHTAGFWVLGVWNILFNVLPVLVQRMNRFSIEKKFPSMMDNV